MIAIMEYVVLMEDRKLRDFLERNRLVPSAVQLAVIVAEMRMMMMMIMNLVESRLHNTMLSLVWVRGVERSGLNWKIRVILDDVMV